MHKKEEGRHWWRSRGRRLRAEGRRRGAEYSVSSFRACMIVLPSASPSRRGECTLVLGIHESALRRRAAGRARDGAPTLPLESNGERKRSLFISYYSRMMRRALPLAATCILQGDMKKVGRNATTREARKGDRGEMQRVKFNLGMTSLPATKRTRTDADGGGGAEGGGRGSALLSPLESGSGCRTADFWTSGVDEAWESATDLTAVAAAGLVKLSPCGAPLI